MKDVGSASRFLTLNNYDDKRVHSVVPPTCQSWTRRRETELWQLFIKTSNLEYYPPSIPNPVMTNYRIITRTSLTLIKKQGS